MFLNYNVNNGLILSDFGMVSNYSSWLTLATEIARGNLFPIDPYLGQGGMGIRFFPYLSLWITGGLISAFGWEWTLLIGSTILPTSSYILMVLIYRIYLPLRWAIALSALGVLGFNSVPFRDFMANIIMGSGWTDLGVISQPDIMGFPFPAVSLLLFLFVFYLSIQRKYLSTRRMFFLSIAWGLQSQIHILNLIFGLPFWLIFLALTIWRSNKNSWSNKQSRQWIIQVFIVGISCVPMVFCILNQTNQDIGLQALAGANQGESGVGYFFFVAYFILPLAILKLAYFIFRIDGYELIYKFIPVWTIMFVELMVTLAWELFGVGIPSALVFSRMGLFFCHLFYFTPVIYCMNSSHSNYSLGTEAYGVSVRVRLFLSWLFQEASKVYLPIFLVLLTGFAMASTNKVHQSFYEESTLDIHGREKALRYLIKESQPGDVLIGPDNYINLTLPINGRYGTLWSNAINSTIDSGEVMERFATYAKVFNWTEDQYLLFMLPGDVPFNDYRGVFDFLSTDVIPGLGYWLVFHNKRLEAGEYNDYLFESREVYASVKVENKLKEYNVKRVLLKGQLEFLANVPTKVVGEYTLYYLQ